MSLVSSPNSVNNADAVPKKSVPTKTVTQAKSVVAAGFDVDLDEDDVALLNMAPSTVNGAMESAQHETGEDLMMENITAESTTASFASSSVICVAAFDDGRLIVWMLAAVLWFILYRPTSYRSLKKYFAVRAFLLGRDCL